MSKSLPIAETTQKALVGHRLVNELTSLARWRCFMEHHVFCVWDFMSLLKRLQRDHTCVEIPWRPTSRPDLARFVNEMVLEEESDQDLEGQATSHLSLYLRAMSEVGADRTYIDRAIGSIAQSETWQKGLRQAKLSPLIESFVSETFHIAVSGKPHEVAAAFFYGREQVLPLIFGKLVQQSRKHPELATLTYYFERHIELDGGSHSKLAEQLLDATLAQNSVWEKEADASAQRSLSARSRLWETLAIHLRSISTVE